MPKPLDSTSLRLFVAVCEHASIARAAADEALVPSALSKRIAALEADAGVTLLRRQRRGVLPTPAGEALLRQAREVLAALDRMRAEMGSFGRGVQGSVHVLASPSVLAERLPDDVGRFLAAQPAIRVTLAERASTYAWRWRPATRWRAGPSGASTRRWSTIRSASSPAGWSIR